MFLATLIGATAAASSYLYAKKKNASAGESAAAAAVGGTAAWGATAVSIWILAAIWPAFVLGGVMAGGYYLGSRRKQRALPPASEF